MDLIHYSFAPLISCSLHAQFASLTFIDCKWRWGVGIFELLVFHCFV